MSNPYRFTPGRLPAAPHPTPASVSGYTLPNSKIGRTPIANPYDKFTQPEFDAWIGDITGALKRALGHDEGPPRAKEALSEGGDIPQFRPIDLPEDSDNDGVDDSFAEVKARRAAGKGKARDPREGPGFGKLSVAQPIEIPSSDEEEEEEVEYSILHQSDSDAEEEPQDSEGEGEEDEEYPWSTVEESQNIRASPARVRRDAVGSDNDEYEGEYEAEHEEAEYGEYDEEAEYEEYDEEAESDGQVQGRVRPEDEVIELLSDDEEPPVTPNLSRLTTVEEERFDEEEYHDEAEEYGAEGTEEDQEGPRAGRKEEDIVADEDDEADEVQPLEDDLSFPPQVVEPLATTSTRRSTSVEIPDPWRDPRLYAQAHYASGELQTSSEQKNPSYSGAEGEVNDGTDFQVPNEAHEAMEELQYLDNSPPAETIPMTSHDLPQHTGNPVFVIQAGADGYLHPSGMPLDHTNASASFFGGLSFDRKSVEPAEEHFIQPSDENTSFPVQAKEQHHHLVQIPDPWHGPREYAQDFYAGGNIPHTPWVHLNADHLVPQDESNTDQSQARMEQEAEDDEIQPQEQDTAFLHDGVRAGAVEIRDPWEGPETYAQDYYSGGINGALPTERIDPALLSGTGEAEDEYSSFLTPYTRTPSQAVDTEAEEQQEDEGDGSDRFALPPAPEGVYTPPSLRARDAPIPVDAEIFNVDDSDDEENGEPIPITEYPQDEEIIKARDEAVNDELEYVDEDGVYVAEAVSIPEGASRDRDIQSEPVLKQILGQEDLAIPKESEEVSSSLLDWNNLPAFPSGAPASASGHLATPPSEGGVSVVAERSTVINNQATVVEEVTTQGDLISTGKEQISPPPDDAVISSMLQHEAVAISETTELPATSFADASETYIDVTEHLSEEVQEHDEPSAQISVTNGNAAVGVDGPEDSAMEDVSGRVPEVDQSTTVDMSEHLPPIDSQHEESTAPELDPTIEEVMPSAQSRAGTAPIPDTTLEELDHRGFLTDEKDMRPVVDIVDHEETPASSRETVDHENIIVEIMEEHAEHAFTPQHSDLAHPMFTILHPAHSDDLSYEDYASSVEVDELDEEEARRPNEDVAPSVLEVSVEQSEVEHPSANAQVSSQIPEDVVFTTNVPVGSDVPFNPPLVEEVSEGKVYQIAPPFDTNDATPLQNHARPPSSNSAGKQWRIIADAPAGNEPTLPLPHPAEAYLTKLDEDNNTITDASGDNIPVPKASQTTGLSQQEPAAFAADLPSIVMEVGDGAHVHDSIARSQTPVQEDSHPPTATPDNASTTRYPEGVYMTPERYTPSPPKSGATEAPQVSSPIPDTAARDMSSHLNDVGSVVWMREDLKDVTQPISRSHNTKPQPTSPTNGALSLNQQSLFPPYTVLQPPPPGPHLLSDNQLDHSRHQSTANIVNPIPTMVDAESRFQRPFGEPNIQQSSFSQASVFHTPVTFEQFHPQIPPTLSGTWPYSLSTPGAQQLSTYVDPPISSLPKGAKKPKATGASPKSPKKGKKTAQHKKPHAEELSSKLHYPIETVPKLTLPDTTSDVKGTTIQDDLLQSKTVMQSGGDIRSVNVPGLSGNFYGKDNLFKGESLPAVTVLEPPSTQVPKVEGVGHLEKGPQKPKRTYKRKRDASPGPGEPQVAKTDEKKAKRPTKRKSKLLELEGPIPGPSNGETIHVKAKPKGATPIELSQTDPPTTSKETITKSKKGQLSVQPASLHGSTAPQIPKPEVFLITRAGISHRHGSDLTIPPAAPSFKVLSPRTTSPRKPSLPQTLRQTQPFTVPQSGASSTPESSNFTTLPPTSTMPDADTMPSTNIVQPNEFTKTESPAVSAVPVVPQSPPVGMQTLPAPTQTAVQHPESVAAPSDPQTQSNVTHVTHVSAKSRIPSNSPTVAPMTTPTPDTPSAPVVRPITASVNNTPTSQAGTPKTTMRETRSSCRYHRISLPKEEGGPRVRFLVPGCAMTNHILMKEQEIVDHGLAPVEDAYVMIKDIESLDLDSDLISVLRVLVGHDIFRDQELFYLPSPGEQLHARPAFRKPTPSDRLESSRHNAGSPSHSSLIGSPTFHKSSASVSGSTSSLSALRQAHTPEWSSNIAPTDSEGDSDNEDAHSKASHQASDHNGKGKSRARGRKSKLGRDPDFVPTKEDENKLSDAGDSTRKRRKPTGGKRGVKRTRTEAPAGDDPTHQNKKLKAHSTAPPSVASPEKPSPPDVSTNDS